MKTLLIALLTLSLTACCGCRKNRSTVPFRGTEWHLTQLNGTSVESENYRVTFADDGRVAGIGACNRFTGTFTTADMSLDVTDDLVSTRMMCLGENRETEFLQMLRDVDAYTIDGDKLMLIRNGDVLGIMEVFVEK